MATKSRLGMAAVLLIGLFVLLPNTTQNAGIALAQPARAASAPAIAANTTDDRENTTPSGWWVYAHQTITDTTNFINANNARIVDLYVESTSAPYLFTVTYVPNTGAYAKGWAWYVDVDEGTLASALSANNARLTVLKAYDIGNGTIHFFAVMVANTGADNKGWWWYFDQDTTQVSTQLAAHNARLVQVNSYVNHLGQTRYAVVMISNTGSDSMSSWWYVGVTPAQINALLSTNSARVYDLDYITASGNYNVVMNGWASGYPAWWWYIGITGAQILELATQTGARPIDLNAYPGCGSTCFALVLINNSNDISTRVGELLRNGLSGAANGANVATGLYLKQVGGPVLAHLEDGFAFEPASSIKVALNLYATRQIEASLSHLTDQINHYQPPVGTSCPGNTVIGTESLDTAMREMMWHSDNTRTREISDTFGAANVNSMMTNIVGMTKSSINHIIGCGAQPQNQLTLDDAGKLYEGVANGTLLNAPNRAIFYGHMAGKAQFLSEGYDWTHLWDTDIPNLISQEAPVGMPAALRQAYRDQMDLAYKAGNYNVCPGNAPSCGALVFDIAIAGWVQLPFCTAAGPASRQYVFGTFIYQAPNLTNASNTFNATKSELLREQIHAGLASCFHQTYLPIGVRP